MITDSTSRTRLYCLQKHQEQQNESGCPRAIHPALASGNFQMNADGRIKKSQGGRKESQELNNLFAKAVSSLRQLIRAQEAGG